MRERLSRVAPRHEAPDSAALREIAGPVLTVSHLGISMAGRQILHDVNFSLPRRASLAIIGPNGSGKTLLLNALLGLLPAAGSIQWSAGTRLGYVPQKVAADVRLPLRAGELLHAKARLQRLPEADVKAIVEWAGLEPLLGQKVGTLSSGQLQKVLIAFAMAGSPDVLLVDEPTSSLDELAEEHIFELLGRARRERGMTVILVSHDLTLVRDTATHVLCVGGGTASFGTANDMLVPEILERVYRQPLEFHEHRKERNR
jgi:zinc transport system ATP-binding protein